MSKIEVTLINSQNGQSYPSEVVTDKPVGWWIDQILQALGLPREEAGRRIEYQFVLERNGKVASEDDLLQTTGTQVGDVLRLERSPVESLPAKYIPLPLSKPIAHRAKSPRLAWIVGLLFSITLFVGYLVYNRNLRVVETESFDTIALPGHQSPIELFFSPDSELLGTFTSEWNAYSWDVSARTLLQSRDSFFGECRIPESKYISTMDETYAIFSSDRNLVLAEGAYLYYGTNNTENVIFVWEVSRKDSCAVIRYEEFTGKLSNPHSSPSAFSPDGNLFASGIIDESGEYSLILWGIPDGHLARIIANKKKDGWLYYTVFSPDSKVLATGVSPGLNEKILLWSVLDGSLLNSIEIVELGYSHINKLAFSLDGSLLASGVGGYSSGARGVVSLWRVSDGKLIQTLLTKKNVQVEGLAFSPDGRILTAGLSNGAVIFWRVSDGHRIQTLNTDMQVSSVAFSPDGNWFAVGGYNQIVLWKVIKR